MADIRAGTVVFDIRANVRNFSRAMTVARGRVEQLLDSARRLQNALAFQGGAAALAGPGLAALAADAASRRDELRSATQRITSNDQEARSANRLGGSMGALARHITSVSNARRVDTAEINKNTRAAQQQADGAVRNVRRTQQALRQAATSTGGAQPPLLSSGVAAQQVRARPPAPSAVSAQRDERRLLARFSDAAAGRIPVSDFTVQERIAYQEFLRNRRRPALVTPAAQARVAAPVVDIPPPRDDPARGVQRAVPGVFATPGVGTAATARLERDRAFQQALRQQRVFIELGARQREEINRRYERRQAARIRLVNIRRIREERLAQETVLRRRGGREQIERARAALQALDLQALRRRGFRPDQGGLGEAIGTVTAPGRDPSGERITRTGLTSAQYAEARREAVRRQQADARDRALTRPDRTGNYFSRRARFGGPLAPSVAGFGVPPGAVGGASLLAGGFIGITAIAALARGVGRYAEAWQELQNDLGNFQTNLTGFQGALRGVDNSLRDGLGSIIDFVAGSRSLTDAFGNLGASIGELLSESSPAGQRFREFGTQGAGAAARAINFLGGTGDRLANTVGFAGAGLTAAAGGFTANIIARPIAVGVGLVSRALALLPGPLRFLGTGLKTVAEIAPSLATAFGTLAPFGEDLRDAFARLGSTLGINVDNLVAFGKGVLQATTSLVEFVGFVAEAVREQVAPETSGALRPSRSFGAFLPTQFEGPQFQGPQFTPPGSPRTPVSGFGEFDIRNSSEVFGRGFNALRTFMADILFNDISAYERTLRFHERPTALDPDTLATARLEFSRQFLRAVPFEPLEDIAATTATSGLLPEVDAERRREAEAARQRELARLRAAALRARTADELRVDRFISERAEGRDIPDPFATTLARRRQFRLDQGEQAATDFLRRSPRLAAEQEALAGAGGAFVEAQRLPRLSEDARIGLEVFRELNAEVLALAQNINQGIAGTAADALVRWAQGALSASEAFKQFATSVIADIARIILQQSILNAIGGAGGAGGIGGFFAGLFGGGTPRQLGGPVTSGRSYLVGEAGPELFTPSSDGMITANGARGGGVTVINNWYSNDTSAARATFKEFEPELLRKARAQALQDNRRPGLR